MDAAFDTNLMMMLTVMLLPFVGIIMAITPYLMRRGEVFAVTVPTAEQNDPYVRKLKRHYALIVSLITLGLTVAAFVCALAGNASGTIVLMGAGTLGLCVVGYALMLFYRAKMKAYKRSKGWVAQAQETVAVVGERSVPKAISLAWNLLYLPVMVVTFVVGAVGYAHMPDVIPLHVGFDGTVNNWTEKTPMILLMPVLIQGFMAVCFVFSHWTIAHSKKWAEPGAPATSALAYGLFARAQSVYLLVGGLAIDIAMIAMPFSFMNLLTLMQAGVFITIAALILCGGAIVISVVYGQAGSRVFRRMQDSDKLAVDDDERWKLGVFYFNPEDPSLFLPERFGVGWTMNWARPAVWAIMVGGLVITLAFVAAVMVLF